MSAQCEVTAKRAAGAPMSVFERFLSVWVGQDAGTRHLAMENVFRPVPP